MSEKTKELIFAEVQEWMRAFCTDTPESQVDPSMVAMLKDKIDTTPEELKTTIHEVLDRSAYGSLASDFAMLCLDAMWQAMGGKITDPAPWRAEILGKTS